MNNISSWQRSPQNKFLKLDKTKTNNYSKSSQKSCSYRLDWTPGPSSLQEIAPPKKMNLPLNIDPYNRYKQNGLEPIGRRSQVNKENKIEFQLSNMKAKNDGHIEHSLYLLLDRLS